MDTVEAGPLRGPFEPCIKPLGTIFAPFATVVDHHQDQLTDTTPSPTAIDLWHI